MGVRNNERPYQRGSASCVAEYPAVVQIVDIRPEIGARVAVVPEAHDVLDGAQVRTLEAVAEAVMDPVRQ